jgi:L-iditol 2-dehydrogenase
MLAYSLDTGGNLRLAETKEPIARQDNAIIRVIASSICGTDLRAYLHGNSKITPPRIIGHEVCGTLTWVGRQIDGFEKGERVTVAPAIGCGNCYSCKKGRSNLCDSLKTIGFQYDGSFAEYMEIPSQALKQGNVNSVPKAITDEAAALAEPIACVLNSQAFLKIREDDTVAIFGAGFIGCMHAELALDSGARQIIMIDPSPSRREQAAAILPELRILDSESGELDDKISRLTDACGTDVVITACSAGRAQKDALRIAAKYGRISLFGGLPGESSGYLDSNLIHYKELSVYGAHASTPDQNRIALEKLKTSSLLVDNYISEIYPLEEIETALRDLKSETIMKAIIKP